MGGRRAHELQVVNPVPVWRRSLTESGMQSRATAGDMIVVAVFLALVIGLALGLLLG